MPARKIGGKTFTVRPDRVDFRDFPYRPPLRSLPKEYPDLNAFQKYVKLYMRDGMVLQQGDYGACTGFGLASVINYLKWEAAFTNGTGSAPRAAKKNWTRPKKVSESMLYLNARLYDEWPGDDYEGSSCRGAMKGWHKHGVCLQTTWPYQTKDKTNKKKKIEDGPGTPVSDAWRDEATATVLGAYFRIDEKSIVDLQAAIYEIHAIYVAAEAHDGWTSRRLNNCKSWASAVIRPPKDPTDKGGHAFAIVGYTEDGFIIQNSWGPTWGYGGFALLPYADWVENGYDAWALALGAPIANRTMRGNALANTAQTRSPTSLSALSLEERVRGPAGWSLLRPGRKVTPELPTGIAQWTDDDIANHVIVSTVDGAPVRQLATARSAVESVQQVARAALAEARAQSCKDIAIIIHGGLNSKDDGFIRAGFMGPWFLANKIVPIFPIWQTDAGSSLLGAALESIGLDEIAKWIVARGPSAKPDDNALDRRVEDIARHSPGKAAWSEMKNKAFGLNQKSGAINILMEEIKKDPNPPAIHLIGHSAGAIVSAYALDMLHSLGMSAKTVTLYAPACTAELANLSFGAHLQAGRLKTLHIDYLSDDRERKDACVQKLGVTLYSKSLLYLVSRAFESEHKTPILGLEWVLDRTKKAIEECDVFREGKITDVLKWQQFATQFKVSRKCWKGDAVTVTSAPKKGSDVSQPNVHGSFDNNLECVNETIERIRGSVAKPATDLNFGGG